jgi:hypothetical protein
MNSAPTRANQRTLVMANRRRAPPYGVCSSGSIARSVAQAAAVH